MEKTAEMRNAYHLGNQAWMRMAETGHFFIYGIDVSVNNPDWTRRRHGRMIRPSPSGLLV